MRVGLTAGSVVLDEVDVFTDFHVEVDEPDRGRLAEVLAGRGRVAGDHVWLGTDAGTALAGDRATDPAWQAQLAGMLDVAREKGFAEGQDIRAHVVDGV